MSNLNIMKNQILKMYNLRRQQMEYTIFFKNQSKMLTNFDKLNLQKLLHSEPSLSTINIHLQNFQSSSQQKDHFIHVNANTKIRRVFHDVPYSHEQEQAIRDVEQLLLQKDVPKNFYSSSSILKHLYQVSMDTKECCQRIKSLCEFVSKSQVSTYTRKTQKELKQGYAYMLGKDKKMNPIVIIQFDKVDLNRRAQQILNSIYFLMLFVFGVQKISHKFTLILDFSDVSIHKIPFKTLLDIFKYMNLLYCGNLHTTIVYNAYGFTTIWMFLKRLIPEYAREMIHFIKTENQINLLQFINKDQLQSKYGGNINKMDKYWPPSLSDDVKQSHENSISKRQSETQSSFEDQEEFFSIQNDQAIFKEDNNVCANGLCGCPTF